jgi:uncharacterized protein YbaP (TraB family)
MQKCRTVATLWATMTLALAGCSGGESATETAVIPVPIGGEGRPQTLDEAVSGRSEVALWRTGDEDTAVWLLGTIHLLQPGTAWKTPRIERVVAAADAVILEADVLSAGAQRAMNLTVMETAPAPSEAPLSSHYTPEQRTDIDEQLATYGTSLAEIEGYRPWFAATQISLLALIAAGGDPASGADVSLSREAEARNIPLRYLETASEQIAILAAGEDERDAAYFYDLLVDLQNGEAYYADLLGAWYTGDTERIDFLTNSGLANYPDLRGRMLLDRNRRWVETISELIEDEPGRFVLAVGAAHLSGAGSLQDLLREKGYEVERVEGP